MLIDLQKLNYTEEIILKDTIEFPENYYDNTDIVSLNNIIIDGKINLDIENNYVITGKVNGTMMLHDSLTYDVIPYDFNFNIEETLENSLKSLDLIEFLWHYIVLEIPIRYTKSEVSKIENENYRVISEEEYKNKNNPFKDFFVE